VIFQRNTGKLCFATLRAGDGTEIQAMLSLANVGEDALSDWKDLVDIGDHVFVAGEVITSKRGELSVMADEWRMASKSLRPLPVAHKPLNEETRVRQRYVDLIVRPEAQQVARTRVAVVAAVRKSLSDRGFLEVETPMLQTIHGGAAARPFVTESNAFDIELYLRIAPELFLKRAVVGGLERVFEVNRNFRNEGADRTHSPEFTMLEFYAQYLDYRDVARITREVYQEAALAATGSLQVQHPDGTALDLSGEWPEIDLYESLSAAVGEEITPATPRDHLVMLCDREGITFHPTAVPGKLAEELFDRFGHDPMYDLARCLEAAADKRLGPKGIYPNVDFYSGLVYRKLGIPPDLFTPIFAIARTAGWLAHWKEQLGANRIYRPSQIYTGEAGRDWQPIGAR